MMCQACRLARIYEEKEACRIIASEETFLIAAAYKTATDTEENTNMNLKEVCFKTKE
jgi:hypothetical protein